jgi:hypothetical protein
MVHERRYPEFWNTWSSYKEHFKEYRCRNKKILNTTMEKIGGKSQEKEGRY